MTAFIGNQANVLLKRTHNMCQEVNFTDISIVSMMQSVLGLPVVIAMVKEDFYFVATLG